MPYHHDYQEFLYQHFQENTLEYQDNIKADSNYKPDLDEDRSVFSCEVDYTEVLQFGERYTHSSYVIVQYIKLILKANGVVDPSRIPSLSGLQKMRKNVGKETLKNHEETTKHLQCLKFDGMYSQGVLILTWR